MLKKIIKIFLNHDFILLKTINIENAKLKAFWHFWHLFFINKFLIVKHQLK